MTIHDLLQKLQKNEEIEFTNKEYYGPLLAVCQHWSRQRMRDVCVAAVDKHGNMPVYFVKVTNHELMLQNLHKKLKELNGDKS